MSGVAWNVGLASPQPRSRQHPQAVQGADSAGQIKFRDL
jgi:hypothetical protein